jgi:hypothetical protein
VQESVQFAITINASRHEADVRTSQPPEHRHNAHISCTGAAPTKSQVVHFLDAREDPEVDAAIRAFQRAAFKATAAAPEKPDEVPELTAQVQRKYVSAQIVEAGLQVRAWECALAHVHCKLCSCCNHIGHPSRCCAIVYACPQNISVPLSATDEAPVRRYVQQLLKLNSKVRRDTVSSSYGGPGRLVWRLHHVRHTSLTCSP